MRFDETIVFAHYLRDNATGTATWLDVRHGQSLFDDIESHFEAIMSCDLKIELQNESEVQDLLTEAIALQ